MEKFIGIATENKFVIPQLTETEDSWHISSTLDVRYTVKIHDDLFESSDLKIILNKDNSSEIAQFIVIDENVNQLHGDRIRLAFQNANIPVQIFCMKVSEDLKLLDGPLQIVDQLESNGVLRRSNPFIAIGGGVLLDIAGFAASLYRRGVPYIRVPTNLMALIDASLGVKTAVNYAGRRNRLGTYHPPAEAILDRSFLTTVDDRDISNGLGEVLKLAVIKDAHLFNLLENHGQTLCETKLQDDICAQEVIYRSVHGMLEELAPNLWETELERCVDFGHSFSPLVEMRALPELLHGEAVALDVVLSCYLAAHRGLISSDELNRVRNTTQNLGLALWHAGFDDFETVWESLEDATRHRDGKQRLPLPSGLGDYCFVNDITQAELKRALAAMKQAGAQHG